MSGVVPFYKLPNGWMGANSNVRGRERHLVYRRADRFTFPIQGFDFRIWLDSKAMMRVITGVFGGGN